MTRVDVINNFIAARGYRSYLEIGVRHGDSFRGVHCDVKVGVDPDPHSAATVIATSDAFFAGNTQKFDIVFIDGLHRSDQVLRDISNALAALNPGGVVVLHDCLPPDARTADPHQSQGLWCGDVYKAAAWYFSSSPYVCGTVDSDFGIGIIDTSRAATGAQFAFPHDRMEDLTYEEFRAHRRELLHVLSSDELGELFVGPDYIGGIPEDAAVVLCGDGNVRKWCIRLAIASFIKAGVPKSQIFMLTSPDFSDTYAYENSVCVNVLPVVNDVLGITGKVGNGHWGRGIAYKLTMPVISELARFRQVLEVDPDVLCHSQRVAHLLSYPCGDREVVGAGHYSHISSDTVGVSLAEDRGLVVRGALPEDEYDALLRRSFSRNPPHSHIWFNDAIAVWNLDRIRMDLPWYLQRVSMWRKCIESAFTLVTEDFCNVFMDSAALLPQHLALHYGGSVRPPYENRSPAVVHYGGRGVRGPLDARGVPVGCAMVSAAMSLGLDVDGILSNC